MVKIPDRIFNLNPYQAGKPINQLAREKGLTKIVKLASNENPLGPSPKAVEAIKRHLSDIHRYVDPSTPELVLALAEKYNKKPEEIICGHGTDALIGNILTALTEPGDEILTSQATFIGLYVNASKLGRKLSLVPVKDFAFDLEGILAKVTEKTRVVYLANPNNPTGTIFTKSQFENFISRLPRHILVILDEAYSAYASFDPEFPDGLAYDYDNLLVTRTFSKSYGLAGVRIGFAVGPGYLIKELYKVRLPFEPNYLAQMAARAALEDDEFLQKTIQTNRESLDLMAGKFNQLGLRQVKSWGNFILILMPDEKFARAFFEECLNMGLIVRPVKSFGIPHGIRVSSGTIEETHFALEVMEKVYRELQMKLSAQVSA